jgi:hypothetical protein
VTLGFRRKALDQIDDNQAAEDRRQDDPVSPPARPFEDVGVVGDLEDAIDHDVVDQADERPQQDRADSGHDPDPQSHKAEGEEADPPLVAGGGRRRRKGGVSGR